MTTHILFTRSNSVLSRVIRKVTGEPVSHCAIYDGSRVLHSNLLGLHADSPDAFMQHTEIVYTVQVADSSTVAELFKRHSGAGYDFGALLYLAAKAAFPWLPKKNLWQSTGMYLCTEWVTEATTGEVDSMTTPYQLYLRLAKAH